MTIIHEQPSQDYDHFIQDGSVLSKVMTGIVFNSVPLEQIEDNWGVVSDQVVLAELLAQTQKNSLIYSMLLIQTYIQYLEKLPNV